MFKFPLKSSTLVRLFINWQKLCHNFQKMLKENLFSLYFYKKPKRLCKFLKVKYCLSNIIYAPNLELYLNAVWYFSVGLHNVVRFFKS